MRQKTEADMTRYCVLLLLVCSLIGPLSPDARAQDAQFGKNKVQYTTFDWSFIQSAHFDVYFSTGGEYLAQFTADIAESSYADISAHFHYQITNRVPIVVYNSHNDFQQTNVVSSYLEEGIGGVTELFKNRVVLPYEGDYKKFRHVIHHELVHAVINDMFYGGSIQSIISNNISLQLPLWFNEGLAEYEALQWDTNSDMFLRDATIHEYLPPIQFLDGYFAYRGGQSVWNYIATKYGREKIGEILTRTRGTRNLDQGFRAAIGLSVTELSERWEKEQKVLYWPDIARREEPADYARRLTDHKKDGSFYNTSPSLSPQGDRIAFISNRDDYFDVFVMNASDGSDCRKVISGQRTPDFEELHLLTPGMAWSPDGKRLALAAKSGDQDAIILFDIDEEREEKLEFDLDGIFSVDWAPPIPGTSSQATRLAFVGVKNGRSDIYIYDLETKALTNLTNDLFSDADPVWSGDGRQIFFASDRKDNLIPGSTPAQFKMQNYDFSQMDLYRIDAATRVITRVTDLPASDETSPALAPDGKHLYFISDMNGINNVYVKDLASDSVRAVTNSLSGVYQLSLSRDGSKMAFNSLSDGGFDLFLKRSPLESSRDIAQVEPTEFIRRKTMKQAAVSMPPARTDSVHISDDVLVKIDDADTTHRYADDVKIDLQNYVFKSDVEGGAAGRPDSAHFPTVTDNVDAEGRYRVNKYKLNFSPDIIYGNAGYNTFYGVQGSTIMAFSDMLGDHQIFILTNLLFDLKNSDYALAYLYLPKRIDYGVQAFHSARFLLLSDTVTGESVYRFRNYGVTGMASYPINKFERLEFNLSWYNISRDNMDYTFVPSQHRSLIIPSIGYVHDTSLWGIIAPSNGKRFNINLTMSPKVGGQSLGFYSVTGDYRQYYKLWQRYTVALRLAGGGSFGEDPQRFIIGGVDNWINRQFEGNHIPMDNAEDFVFLTSGIPLRGYNYNARIGTKYTVANMEFHFPLMGYLSAGPLPVFFQSFNGLFFIDMGAAWTGRNDFRAFAVDAEGNTYMKDLLLGTGYGARMIFLGFLLKMDVAWSYNLQHFSAPKYYFSVGADI
jgi:Tol biopolymer transport system component